MIAFLWSPFLLRKFIVISSFSLTINFRFVIGVFEHALLTRNETIRKYFRKICVCKYFFRIFVWNYSHILVNPTAMLKLLCHAEYVWVANFSTPAQIWALFSIRIDFKGELTYSKHAGIDILHTSLQCWSRLNTYFIREQQFGHEFP